MAGASKFPRHWIYDATGALAAKAGLADFRDWYRTQFGKRTPWGREDSRAYVTAVETALERQLSSTIMRGGEKPWLLYHCTRGAHFDNYPHEKFRGKSPSKHPYKDTIIELDDIVGRLVRKLEATGQLENTLVFVSSDNGPEMETWPDAAYTPFRCAKGSTWEGGVRVPGIFLWPGMIDADHVSDGLFNFSDFLPTALALAGVTDKVPADRYIDGIDQSSFLLAPDGFSNRKYHYYWLGGTLSALRVGEYKFVTLAAISADIQAQPENYTVWFRKYLVEHRPQIARWLAGPA